MLVSDRGLRGLADQGGGRARPAQPRRGAGGDGRRPSACASRPASCPPAWPAGRPASAGTGWSGPAASPARSAAPPPATPGPTTGTWPALVERVLAWTPEGERAFAAAELDYAYRASRFKRSREAGAILSVDLRLRPGSQDAAVARIEAFERQRREKQPTERSCGSVFKNPYPDHAGRLIEAAGLKGTAAGDAQISLKHGNFFVNRGRARAADVVALIRLARERVEAASGVRLETEILFAGDWRPEDLP